MRRKLSAQERVLWPITLVAACVKVKQTSTKSIKEDFIRQTLNYLQKKYPSLRTHIENLPDSQWFMDNNDLEIPFRIEKVAAIPNDNELTHIIKQEINTPLDDSGPLLRLRVFTSSEDSLLIFTMSHVIADGKSFAILIEDFFSTLSKLQQENKIVDPISLPELPALEYLLPTCAKVMPNMSDPENSNNTSPQCAENEKIHFEIMPSEKLHTDLVFRGLSKEYTEIFVKGCKKHNITVTCAIAAAAIVSLYRNILLKHQNLKNTLILASTSIDIRKHCIRSLEGYMGNFISNWPFISNINSNTDFLQLAQQYKTELETTLNNGGQLPFAYALDTAADKLFDLSDPTKLLPSLLITNVGKLDLLVKKQHPYYTIENLSFCGSVHGFSRFNYSYICIVSSFAEQLSICMPYSTPLISRQEAEYFLEGILFCFNKHMDLIIK